ncbi:unnamed protein product [Sphagnum tenellum]
MLWVVSYAMLKLLETLVVWFLLMVLPASLSVLDSGQLRVLTAMVAIELSPLEDVHMVVLEDVVNLVEPDDG